MSKVSCFRVVFIFISGFLVTLTCPSPPPPPPAQLHPDEVKAVEEIVEILGVKGFKLSEDPCQSGFLKITEYVSRPKQNNTITCDCSFDNNTTCHIKHLILKTFSLSGRLPPQLIKLQYLESIDLCRNYLSGTIPVEWASMPHLKSISLCANRLSGNLPSGLGNFTNLTFLGLEANQFSGTLPDELGNLINLEGVQLGSNQFTGSLPNTLARLSKLKDFMISDNNFSGSIPEYIGHWSQLERLFLFASGLKGPLPESVSHLENLTDLRISDTTGIYSFPNISSNKIKFLILRNLNMSGTIPSSIWQKPDLQTLDLSFNKLTGDISWVTSLPKYTYLTGNMLSGKVDSGIFTASQTQNIDLSYNNFTWSSRCEESRNVNTYRSSYSKSNSVGLFPCQKKCQNYEQSIHINCGGEDETIGNTYGKVMYQGDKSAPTTAAMNHNWTNWGLSNTGDFMDDNGLNDEYIILANSSLSVNFSTLYKTARKSALSLVYYAFCLENGTYRVKLHFMEIQFTDEELFGRVARRIFDVYIQGKLVFKDFNIKEEAKGAYIPIEKEVNTTVTDHTLEIRLYWAGKGTTLIPRRGNYGPLISAISLCHSSLRHCGVKNGEHRHVPSYHIILAATVSFIFIIFLVLGIYCRRRCIREKNAKERDLRAQGLQTVCFTWRQLQVATKKFDEANKLGEGGFGSVFKGELSDGTAIAVKQLSSKSCQGNREFVNEIGMISGLDHPNLVKLYGCCVEKNQLLLVYEYMENNSLALVLFGKSGLKLDWAARQKICVGIARGLEFLHEGSMIRMVHRDIKTTNVLLDADLNAKISDFGLARLHEEDQSHISTRIAGTIGYMAPEYALWGHLTEKADVYSFGVVALEIVSGKNNVKHKGTSDDASLINWGFMLQQKGDLLEIVDPELKGDFDRVEAERMIKVGLLCTNSSPSSRPTMTEAVKMLEGAIEITQSISDPLVYGDLDFSRLRASTGTSWSVSGTEASSSWTQATATVKSSVSGYDLYPFNPESVILDTTGEISSST